ncbi:MAG: dihydrofolate reductase family protein [Terrimesophilobacter sp.]
MKVTRLLPAESPQFTLDFDSADSMARLDGLYAVSKDEWLRINLVASINGNATGADGTSASLTVGADRRILGAIRRNADVVLVGASSVRREGYFLPKTAPLAIVTSTGDLSGHRIPTGVESGRVIVLCPPTAVDRLAETFPTSVTIIPLPGPSLQPRDIAGALRDRGLARIVCEGGPRLAAQLVNDEIVDELCLTMSPQLNGAMREVLPGLGKTKQTRLSQLLIDSSDALYGRWTILN